MHVSGARLFLGADRRNFKDNCDSKHECDTIKGYGSTEEAAKRYFPREISEVIDERAGQRKKPGDKMNPTWDAFKMKFCRRYKRKCKRSVGKFRASVEAQFLGLNLNQPYRHYLPLSSNPFVADRIVRSA